MCGHRDVYPGVVLHLSRCSALDNGCLNEGLLRWLIQLKWPLNNGDKITLYTCDCFCPASVHHICARNTLEQRNILLRIYTKVHTYYNRYSMQPAISDSEESYIRTCRRTCRYILHCLSFVHLPVCLSRH